MSLFVKTNRRPGKARPDSGAQVSEIHKRFRIVRPWVFVRKVSAMTILVMAFGVGVAASSVFVKQAIAALICVAPLWCAVEMIAKTRSQWAERTKAIGGAVGCVLVAMSLFSLALAIPTLVCQYCIGAMLAHGTELAHQALHRKGTGIRDVDWAIGVALCGASFMSFFRFMWTHMRHHKLNGTSHDRESFDYQYDLLNSPSRALRMRGLFMHLTLAGHYFPALERMWLALRGKLRNQLLGEHGDMPSAYADKIQSECRYQCALLLVVGAVSIYFQTALVLKLWLVPVLIGWGPVHSLIESTEHFGCDLPNADVFCNTRSLKASGFAQWFTNYNNCHVGHHWDMSVPADNLPEFEAMLAVSNRFRHLEPSYPAFYVRFVAKAWRGSALA